MLMVVALVAAACAGSGDAGSTSAEDGTAAETEAPGERSNPADGTTGGEPAGDLPSDQFDSSEGGQASLASFVGQPLVVNFFASWCPPCRAEMPDFEEVHQAVGDEVTFVGIAHQDARDDAADIVETTGVSYEWLHDPRGELFLRFQNFSMPTTLYFDADGRLLDRDNGPIDAGILRERIEGLLEVTPA